MLKALDNTSHHTPFSLRSWSFDSWSRYRLRKRSRSMRGTDKCRYVRSQRSYRVPARGGVWHNKSGVSSTLAPVLCYLDLFSVLKLCILEYYRANFRMPVTYRHPMSPRMPTRKFMYCCSGFHRSRPYLQNSGLSHPALLRKFRVCVVAIEGPSRSLSSWQRAAASLSIGHWRRLVWCHVCRMQVICNAGDLKRSILLIVAAYAVVSFKSETGPSGSNSSSSMRTSLVRKNQ